MVFCFLSASLQKSRDAHTHTHIVDIECTGRIFAQKWNPIMLHLLIPNQADKAMNRLWYSQVRLRPLAGVAAETGEISKTMRQCGKETVSHSYERIKNIPYPKLLPSGHLT